MLSALCETEYTCGKHFMKMFPTSVIELESIIKVIVQSRRRSSPLCCVFKSAIPMRGFCFCYGPRKYAAACFFLWNLTFLSVSAAFISRNKIFNVQQYEEDWTLHGRKIGVRELERVGA